jgi:hypothetical protein
MRKTTIALCAAILAVSLCGCARRSAESLNPAPVADVKPDPAVLAWLEAGGNVIRLDPITSSLATMTNERDWRDRLMKVLDEYPLIKWNEDRAVPVTVGSESYILLIRGGSSPSFPGEDIQVLILIDHQGAIHDVLACAASNRVTGGAARFHTIAPLMTEQDGACAVIRLDGANARGNFKHSIVHAGQLKRYKWDQGNPAASERTRWNVRSLCRVAIVDGKFRVLFPDPVDGHSR